MYTDLHIISLPEKKTEFTPEIRRINYPLFLIKENGITVITLIYIRTVRRNLQNIHHDCTNSPTSCYLYIYSENFRNFGFWILSKSGCKASSGL